MEMECGLFNLKDKRVEQFWDVVRRKVYMTYYQRNNSAINKEKSQNIKKSIITSIWFFVSTIIYYIIKLGKRTLVIPNTRYLDNEGCLFDKAAHNIITSLGNDAYIINTRFPGKKYRYKSSSGIIMGYFSRKFSSCCPDNNNVNIIHDALVKYLGEDILPKGLIDSVYRDFLAKRAYFNFLFSIKRFKSVFFVQNGSYKGMFAAAKKHHIKTIEIQHGSFEVSHPAYSYPNGISYSDSRILMPDYMATFGPYWGHNFNLPVKKIIALGNDCYYQSPKREVPQGHIVIISSSVHANYLIPFTLQLASKYKDIKIYYKLHSGESVDNAVFKDCRNVEVITEQYNATELIFKAELVVVVNSTVLYEALNFNRKIAMLKVLDYEGQRSLFDMPNVFLVDAVDDIEDALAAKTITVPTYFFAPFNEEVFKTI